MRARPRHGLSEPTVADSTFQSLFLFSRRQCGKEKSSRDCPFCCPRQANLSRNAIATFISRRLGAFHLLKTAFMCHATCQFSLLSRAVGTGDTSTSLECLSAKARGVSNEISPSARSMGLGRVPAIVTLCASFLLLSSLKIIRSCAHCLFANKRHRKCNVSRPVAWATTATSKPRNLALVKSC